ncbi:MAG TPA: hypothetical protein VF630_16055, partial [Hymenobacter sp.]
MLSLPLPHLFHSALNRPRWHATAGALLLLAAGFARPAQAQKYRTAAGVRGGGGTYGLTVQQLVLPKTTLEGLGMLSPRERSVTLLGERHFG